MKVFEAIPKNWGNSIGITIPKELVKQNRIKPKKKIRVIVLTDEINSVGDTFGTLKFKKSTDDIMREIDEGYN